MGGAPQCIAENPSARAAASVAVAERTSPSAHDGARTWYVPTRRVRTARRPLRVDVSTVRPATADAQNSEPSHERIDAPASQSKMSTATGIGIRSPSAEPKR